MSKHWKWVKLAVIGLACVSTANADNAPGHTGGMKGLVVGGSFEGGVNHKWSAGAKNTRFLVDHAALNTTAEVSDKVKVVFKHFPLNMHPEAKPAAIAAVAAGKQGKFKEMHDKLFENQTSLGKETYDSIAKQIGLDLNAWYLPM